MPERRHQQPDTEGLVCFQAAGIVVHAVIELFRGGFHALAVFFTDRETVEHPGDGAERHARFPGDIFHSWL